MKKFPRIGVGVIIFNKKNQVLLGERQGSHGQNTWSFPGGHLEFFEPIFDCAKRETMEETGLKITNLKKSLYTNSFHQKENKHYLTIFITADCIGDKPKTKEPHKIAKWSWFNFNKLPQPLFLPIQDLLNQIKLPITRKKLETLA